jgi:hypothetical protein
MSNAQSTLTKIVPKRRRCEWSVMGRFLDDLYETGVSSIYQVLAGKTVDHLDLACLNLNLDTTSFGMLTIWKLLKKQ